MVIDLGLMDEKSSIIGKTFIRGCSITRFSSFEKKKSRYYKKLRLH
jgi:hypothetical protein